MTERLLRGLAAAPGLAIGPLFRARRRTTMSGKTGTPEEELTRLEAAVATAKAELERLASSQESMAAEILAFQIELLEDPSLTEGIREAIAAGANAAVAWSEGLGSHVAEYDAAEDDYFRARASDLRDLMERVLAHLSGGETAQTLPQGAILLDHDLTPSRFLALDWTRLGGAALEAGSPASHMAMLARARGVPLVTGLGPCEPPAGQAVLDADEGVLILSPSSATMQRHEARLAARRAEDGRDAAVAREPAVTASGEPVEVMVNVDDPLAVDDATLAAADGVGLMRTEFLFLGRERLPDENEQYAAYARLLARLDGKPLIVRTLDVGGDKPLPGVGLPAESNPFLGLRGLRLCLERPDLFRPQVRALLRAATLGPLKVMLPMVTVAGELLEAKALFERCLDELSAEGTAAMMPPLGIMVETPASALAIETLSAAFFSIGSNDLTQYVMAAARDGGGRVAALGDPLHPAVLRLIGEVVAHGARTGLPVSLCGDMASDEKAVAALLRLGLRRLSLAPAALARIKAAIRRFEG
jgi:phosphotransferase system enzyme I (PtsI)